MVKSRPLRSVSFVVVVTAGATALEAAPGCASVLGVDKTYTLIDAGTVDEGALGADAGASGTDAGDAGVDGAGTIRCVAGSVCRAGSEECCMSSSDTLACVSTSLGDPCPDGTDIPCDDPSDCPGAVCCIELDSQGYLLATQCVASCPTSGGWTELCTPPGSAGTACPQGSCSALSVFPDPPLSAAWFYGCQ